MVGEAGGGKGLRRLPCVPAGGFGRAYGSGSPPQTVPSMPALENRGEFPEVRLKDLRPGLPPVHILGRVVTVSRKEITRKSDGRRHAVLSGLLTDGTATVRFTWWDPPSEGVDRGTVLRAANAQVREFRDQAELTFGWSTRIQPASDLELPTLRTEDLPLRGVADLKPRTEGFRLEVRVVDVVERTVTVGEERRVVHSGHLADGTGSIPFTAWIDFRLKPGTAIRVVGGYVRMFRGAPELALDERTHVDEIDPQQVGPTPAREIPRLSLGELEYRGGGPETEVEGLIVALGAPSGVVRLCPTCGRVLREGVCRLHAAVQGTPDLRLRLHLDDGTGVATVNLARGHAEKLTGQTLDQLLESLRRQPDPSVVEGVFRRQLIGRRLRVRGRARVDDFGLALFPTTCEEIPVQPDSSVQRLSSRLAEPRS